MKNTNRLPKMLVVEFLLRSAAPLSWSRPLLKKESGVKHDAYEEASWRQRFNEHEGQLVIPAMALTGTLQEAAKFKSETIPGKGKATWTKHFDTGIMVTEPLSLGVDSKALKCEEVFTYVAPGGASKTRVWKKFPILDTWQARGRITLVDEVLIGDTVAARDSGAKGKVQEYLEQAGLLIGIGRWRPRNKGIYGRFSVEDFAVVDA